MVHVRDDAKRLAALGGVLVAGVQVAELVQARREMRQSVSRSSRQARTWPSWHAAVGHAAMAMPAW